MKRGSSGGTSFHYPQSLSERPLSPHAHLISSSTCATRYLASPQSSYPDLDLDNIGPHDHCNQSSSEKSTVGLLALMTPRPSPRKLSMRPSPLGKGSSTAARGPQTPEDGYETSSTMGTDSRRRGGSGFRRPGHAPDILQEMPEIMAEQEVHEAIEAQDRLSCMQTEKTLGVIAMGLGYTNAKNQSSVSLASRQKADKVLGLDPNAKLASFYLVSGLPRVSRRMTH